MFWLPAGKYHRTSGKNTARICIKNCSLYTWDAVILEKRNKKKINNFVVVVESDFATVKVINCIPEPIRHNDIKVQVGLIQLQWAIYILYIPVFLLFMEMRVLWRGYLVKNDPVRYDV